MDLHEYLLQEDGTQCLQNKKNQQASNSSALGIFIYFIALQQQKEIEKTIQQKKLAELYITLVIIGIQNTQSKKVKKM